MLVLQLANKDTIDVRRFSTIITRAWNLSKGAQLCHIMAVAKLRRVLNGDPWWFKESLVLMERWDPEREPELEFRRIRTWVQVHRLPPMLRTVEVSKDFAALTEQVFRSSTPELKMARRKFIRFQVEIGVEEPLGRGCYWTRYNKRPHWIAFRCLLS